MEDMRLTLKWLSENGFIEMATEVLRHATVDGTLDPALQKDMNLWNIPGWIAFDKNDFEAAEKIYRTMVESIVEREKKDKKRYHKGMPFHNLGIALSARVHALGEIAEARHAFKKAYEEDIKTKGKTIANSGLAKEALDVIGEFDRSIDSKVLRRLLDLTCPKCGNPLIQNQYCNVCGYDPRQDGNALTGLGEVIKKTMQQMKDDIQHQTDTG